MTRRKRLLNMPKDWDLLYTLQDQQKADHMRRRLEAIKYLWEGRQMGQVCTIVDCNIKTLRTWVDLYLEGGFTKLLTPIRRPKQQKLDAEQKQKLRVILLNDHPAKYGYNAPSWTEPLVESLLEDHFNTSLKKSRVYEILGELRVKNKKRSSYFAGIKGSY